MAYLKYRGKLIRNHRPVLTPYAFGLRCSELPDGFEPPPGGADGLTLVKVDDAYTWLDLTSLGLVAEDCGDGYVPELVIEGDYMPVPDNQEPDEQWPDIPAPDATDIVIRSPEDNALLTVLPLRSVSSSTTRYANKPKDYVEHLQHDVSDSWPMQGDYYVYEQGSGLFGTPIYCAGDDRYMMVLQWHGVVLRDGWTNAAGMPRWCLCRTSDIEQLRQVLSAFSVTHGARGYEARYTAVDLYFSEQGLPYLALVSHTAGSTFYNVQDVYATEVRQIGNFGACAITLGADGAVSWNKKLSADGHVWWTTGVSMDDYGADWGAKITHEYVASIVDYYEYSEDYDVGNPPILTDTTYDIPYTPRNPADQPNWLDWRWRQVGFSRDSWTMQVLMWRVNGGLVKIAPFSECPDGAAYSVDGGATWVPIASHALVPMTYSEMADVIAAYTGGGQLPDGWLYSEDKGARKIVTIKFLPIDGYSAPNDIDVPVSYYNITRVITASGYVPLQGAAE